MYVHCIHNCPLIFFQKFQTKYSADRKKKEKKKERKDVVRYINRKEKKSHQTKKKEVASITIEDAPPLSLDNTLSKKNKKTKKKTAGQYLYRNTAVMKEPLAYYYEGVETRCKIDRCILHRIRKTLDDSRVQRHIFIAT